MRLPTQSSGAFRSRETSGTYLNNLGVQAQAGKSCTLTGSTARCDPVRVGNYIVGNLVCIDVYQCVTARNDGSIEIRYERNETSCGECTPELEPGGVASLPTGGIDSTAMLLQRFLRA